MLTQGFFILLTVEFLVGAIVAVCEKKYAVAVYCASAAVLNASLIWMK